MNEKRAGILKGLQPWDPAKTRACLGKFGRYVSERSGLLAAEARTAATGIPLYTYRCPFCKNWHLTSQRPYGAKAKIRDNDMPKVTE